MAESDAPQTRPPETVTVVVVRARDLKGSRGDQYPVQCLVKVEFGEKVLGESPRVDCKPDNPAEINFNTTMTISPDDAFALDEMAYKPVLCTIIEVIPSEKKKSEKKPKEDKTVVLGQCSVDLMPLLEGKTQHRVTLGINPVAGSPMENLPPDHARPELDVQLSVNDPLLSESQLENCNLASVSIESLYSPPEGWSLTGPQYMYTAAMPLPFMGEKENTLVFAGGSLRPGCDKEVPSKQKRWAVPGEAQGNAVLIPDKFISSDHIDEEDGDFKARDDREHRSTAEQEKNRVSWNIDRRCYMDSFANKSLQEKIAKTRYWPIEVARTMLPSGGKAKKDDDSVGFHGVVYLNLAPLLYPGVKRIRGAFKINAYTDSDLQEKTLRKQGFMDEAMKIASGILSRSSSSPFPKPTKGKEEGKGGKDAKKGKQKGDKEPPATTQLNQPQQTTPQSSDKPSNMKVDSASDADGLPVNVEGQQYVESHSYLKVEICLHRPLVRKRPSEELAKRVAEYIPPRPLFPKRTNGAQKAVDDFHSQVGNVANMILDEFREHYGEEFSSNGGLASENTESRRQELIYQLNTSGKYFAFKEQLKYAIVKIVREKYLKTTTFKDQDELQSFLSELYVYLLDQMHVGLNKVLAVEDQSPIPEPLTDSAQLKHFAREAEVNGNFELAAKYYQERIAREKNDADHWLDYGTFCLYINDLTKAEECFKECVAIDQRHQYGLILYGVVCTMQDKHEAAETFFETATSYAPNSILAWTMLGLFYDGIGNDIGAEMALLEANKLNVMEVKAIREAEREKEREIEMEKEREREKQQEKEEEDKPKEEPKEEPSDHQSVHEKESKAEFGSTHEIHGGKHMGPSPMSQAGSDSKPRTGKPGTEARRNSTSHKSGKQRSLDPGSRTGSGHTRSPFGAGGSQVHPPAEDVSEEVLPPREPTPVPTTSIYMQVVEFLLEVKAMPFTERTLAHHLLDDLGGPSAEYYIAMARLDLQKQALEEAEVNLKEALQFDHQHPDAWAIMGHVKYLMGDIDVAKSCYERTLAFISDAHEMHSIYLRLASIYLQESKFEDAKNTFLLACKKSPSCVSWLGVGIACYRLGELSEAEDALSEANILNNSDPEVWAYLSLVCLMTERQLESEQAYKYAMKLNLQDNDLIGELHENQTKVGFGNPEL